MEGLLVPERKLKRAQLLGLGLGLPLLFLSDMVDSGSRVQKALLQPVPIFSDQKVITNHSFSLFRKRSSTRVYFKMINC